MIAPPAHFGAVSRALSNAKSLVRDVASRPWVQVTARLMVGGGILFAVVAHVGTGPFLHGLLSLTVRAVGAATVLAAIATAAAAWRWRLVARRLGVDLRWSSAVALYYQSQFLNTVLPGGVVGDVHRAITHGRNAERIGQASRAVAIERSAGQAVQIALAFLVLVCFGAQFEGYLVTTLAIGASCLIVALLAAAALSRRIRTAVKHETGELRLGLGSVRASAQVAIMSVVVVACHAATFAIATASIGVRVPPLQLLTLALVILLGASIPLNVGGWGPREGIAGWAFALAGLGTSAGVAASTLFGILAIISVAPGAIVTVVFAARRRRASASVSPPHTARRPELQPVTALPPRRQENPS